jgi:hypothetical protein
MTPAQRLPDHEHSYQPGGIHRPGEPAASDRAPAPPPETPDMPPVEEESRREEAEAVEDDRAMEGQAPTG